MPSKNEKKKQKKPNEIFGGTNLTNDDVFADKAVFADVKLQENYPSDIKETEREALSKARIGQGIFRGNVIALWGTCAVTGCSLSQILVASHVVPWEHCLTARERLDPFNGLLLTPNLDKLVDRFLISFNDDGSILLSESLGTEEREILGVGEQSRLRFVRPAMRPYLQRHRELFCKSF